MSIATLSSEPKLHWGPGHGLFARRNTGLAASWTRLLPPQPQDEADLFNAGEAGHERIEYDALRPLVRDDRIIAAVYFGNWQRDMSQLMAPALHKFLGNRAGFVCDLIFGLVDILAEAKFNRRLNRQSFGTYRWEEHSDNPRDFGVALDPATCSPVSAALRQSRPEYEPESPRWSLSLWREGPDATPLYLQTSREYVLRELGRALSLGPGVAGLEHVGNAMHTVEDFYAHSNFIELCYNHLRGDNPMTGTDAQTGQPLRDSRGRYRLTTGVALLDDILSSLSKLLLHHLETPPGARPSPVSQRIVRVLVRRLLGSQALAAYDRLMQIWEATGIPAVVGDLQLALERAVIYPLRLAVTELLRPLSEAAARQTGQRAFPMPAGSPVRSVREISHSRLAKDDPHHHHHGVARQLAILAVQDFWRQMDAAWNRRQTPRFADLVRIYMSHPLAAGDWWIPILGGRVAPVNPVSPPSTRVLPVQVLDRFAFRAASPSPHHSAALDRIARQIATSPAGALIRLVGHADSTGPADYNQRLGRARAQGVRQALGARLDALRPGLSRAVRFVIESRGETHPAADNRSPEGRALNRRVEVLLSTESGPARQTPSPQRPAAPRRRTGPRLPI